MYLYNLYNFHRRKAKNMSVNSVSRIAVWVTFSPSRQERVVLIASKSTKFDLRFM
jgi:hypothetical protein